MPIVFGLYGVFSLFGEFPKVQALVYLFQMVVILYPSFTVFSVLHAHFVQKRAEALSKRLFFEKGRPSHKDGTLQKIDKGDYDEERKK
jgi:hypothetical protein